MQPAPLHPRHAIANHQRQEPYGVRSMQPRPRRRGRLRSRAPAAGTGSLTGRGCLLSGGSSPLLAPGTRPAAPQPAPSAVPPQQRRPLACLAHPAPTQRKASCGPFVQYPLEEDGPTRLPQAAQGSPSSSFTARLQHHYGGTGTACGPLPQQTPPRLQPPHATAAALSRTHPARSRGTDYGGRAAHSDTAAAMLASLPLSGPPPLQHDRMGAHHSATALHPAKAIWLLHRSKPNATPQ